MIEGLELLLNHTGQAGISELRAALNEVLGPRAAGRFISAEKLLRSRVFRLRFELEGAARSLVVKRLSPAQSQLERNVVERWLPLGGFNENGPPLIGTAAEKTGRCIWHIYEDLGEVSLPGYIDNKQIVRKAIDLIANVHLRFADHAVLGECRMFGGNYNISFYASCVGEAVRTLEGIEQSPRKLGPNGADAVDRLLRQLSLLRESRAEREALMQEYHGRETVVHGDLWTNNILVQDAESDLRIRLIDWDHIGAGPVHYDLSTLLQRFPPEERLSILDAYRETIACANWKLPGNKILNMLFETAEYARLANAIIWPAIAVSTKQAEWAIEDLLEISGWFSEMEAVLPLDASDRIKILQ